MRQVIIRAVSVGGLFIAAVAVTIGVSASPAYVQSASGVSGTHAAASMTPLGGSDWS
jgi:hypothetical protein